MDKLEIEMKSLESDLESYPLTLHDPIGDARTYRKMKRYFFSCIVEGIDRAECKNWLYKLYQEQVDEEKEFFTSKVNLLTDALYEFYDYLKKERLL